MPSDPTSAPSATRRHILAGTVGLLAALPVSMTFGQDATPAAGAPERLLFVQIAESGSAEPLSGDPGRYRLTLATSSGQTLYFSDRPERLAGIVTTSDFVAVAVSATARPNAALVFRPESEDSQLQAVALELSDPAYDATSGTVTYTARMLDLGSGTLIADDPSAMVDVLPAEFGEATLFIDDIDVYVTSYHQGKPLHESIGIGRTDP